MDLDDLGTDPVAAMRAWRAEAADCGMNEPDGLIVATGDAVGPDARVVLLKGIDDDGALVFFTNYQSAKGQQLEADPRCAGLLWWDPLRRQIRVRGRVEKVPAERSDAYHAGRPQGSKLSAWASQQSQPIADRAALDAAFQAQQDRHGDGEVPRPPHWGGYRLVPQRIEFWEHRDDRTHDRIVFTREDGAWEMGRIQP